MEKKTSIPDPVMSFHLVDLGDGNGTQLRHYYTNLDGINIYAKEENAYTNGNGLVIEAQNHGVIGGVQSLSGLSIYYPWSFRRGYMEIEAKLAEGQGIVSTWFNTSSRNELDVFYCEGEEIENYQEIDIYETGGEFPNLLRNNLHWSNYLSGTVDNGSECDNRNQFSYYTINETELNFMDDYHVYGLYWDEDFIVMLIDGLIYRYWVKPKPLLPQLGSSPDPLRYEDAMVMHLTCQYGVQEYIFNQGYEEPGIFSSPNHLNHPNPDLPIAEGKMEINYFRY